MSWKTPGQTKDLNLIDDRGAAISSNGHIFFMQDGKPKFSTSIVELLYIVQEFQNHGGEIRVAANPSEWKGVIGANTNK